MSIVDFLGTMQQLFVAITHSWQRSLDSLKYAPSAGAIPLTTLAHYHPY